MKVLLLTLLLTSQQAAGDFFKKEGLSKDGSKDGTFFGSLPDGGLAANEGFSKFRGSLGTNAGFSKFSSAFQNEGFSKFGDNFQNNGGFSKDDGSSQFGSAFQKNAGFSKDSGFSNVEGSLKNSGGIGGGVITGGLAGGLFKAINYLDSLKNSFPFDDNVNILSQFTAGLSKLKQQTDSPSTSPDVLYGKLEEDFKILDKFSPSKVIHQSPPVEVKNEGSLYSANKLVETRKALKTYIGKHPFKFIKFLFKDPTDVKLETNTVQKSKQVPTFLDKLAILGMKKLFKILLMVFGKEAKIGAFVLKIVEKLQKIDGLGAHSQFSEPLDSLHWLGIDFIPPTPVINLNKQVDVDELENEVGRDLITLIASISEQDKFVSETDKLNAIVSSMENLVITVKSLLEKLRGSSPHSYVDRIDRIDAEVSKDGSFVFDNDLGDIDEKRDENLDSSGRKETAPLKFGLNAIPYNDQSGKWNDLQRLFPNNRQHVNNYANYYVDEPALQGRLESAISTVEQKVQSAESSLNKKSEPDSIALAKKEGWLKIKLVLSQLKSLLTNVGDVRKEVIRSDPDQGEAFGQVLYDANHFVDKIISATLVGTKHPESHHPLNVNLNSDRSGEQMVSETAAKIENYTSVPQS